jgi:hypothetical protein
MVMETLWSVDKDIHSMESDYPFDGCIVMFRSEQGKRFFGFMDWSRPKSPIVSLSNKGVTHVIEFVKAWQYVLNEQGNILFISDKLKTAIAP